MLTQFSGDNSQLKSVRLVDIRVSDYFFFTELPFKSPQIEPLFGDNLGNSLLIFVFQNPDTPSSTLKLVYPTIFTFIQFSRELHFQMEVKSI